MWTGRGLKGRRGCGGEWIGILGGERGGERRRRRGREVVEEELGGQLRKGWEGEGSSPRVVRHNEGRIWSIAICDSLIGSLDK